MSVFVNNLPGKSNSDNKNYDKLSDEQFIRRYANVAGFNADKKHVLRIQSAKYFADHSENLSNNLFKCIETLSEKYTDVNTKQYKLLQTLSKHYNTNDKNHLSLVASTIKIIDSKYADDKDLVLVARFTAKNIANKIQHKTISFLNKTDLALEENLKNAFDFFINKKSNNLNNSTDIKSFKSNQSKLREFSGVYGFFSKNFIERVSTDKNYKKQFENSKLRQEKLKTAYNNIIYSLKNDQEQFIREQNTIKLNLFVELKKSYLNFLKSKSCDNLNDITLLFNKINNQFTEDPDLNTFAICVARSIARRYQHNLFSFLNKADESLDKDLQTAFNLLKSNILNNKNELDLINRDAHKINGQTKKECKEIDSQINKQPTYADKEKLYQEIESKLINCQKQLDIKLSNSKKQLNDLLHNLRIFISNELNYLENQLEIYCEIYTPINNIFQTLIKKTEESHKLHFSYIFKALSANTLNISDDKYQPLLNEYNRQYGKDSEDRRVKTTALLQINVLQIMQGNYEGILNKINHAKFINKENENLLNKLFEICSNENFTTNNIDHMYETVTALSDSLKHSDQQLILSQIQDNLREKKRISDTKQDLQMQLQILQEQKTLNDFSIETLEKIQYDIYNIGNNVLQESNDEQVLKINNNKVIGDLVFDYSNALIESINKQSTTLLTIDDEMVKIILNPLIDKDLLKTGIVRIKQNLNSVQKKYASLVEDMLMIQKNNVNNKASFVLKHGSYILQNFLTVGGSASEIDFDNVNNLSDYGNLTVLMAFFNNIKKFNTNMNLYKDFKSLILKVVSNNSSVDVSNGYLEQSMFEYSSICESFQCLKLKQLNNTATEDATKEQKDAINKQNIAANKQLFDYEFFRLSITPVKNLIRNIYKLYINTADENQIQILIGDYLPKYGDFELSKAFEIWMQFVDNKHPLRIEGFCEETVRLVNLILLYRYFNKNINISIEKDIHQFFQFLSKKIWLKHDEIATNHFGVTSLNSKKPLFSFNNKTLNNECNFEELRKKAVQLVIAAFTGFNDDILIRHCEEIGISNTPSAQSEEIKTQNNLFNYLIPLIIKQKINMDNIVGNLQLINKIDLNALTLESLN